MCFWLNKVSGNNYPPSVEMFFYLIWFIYFYSASVYSYKPKYIIETEDKIEDEEIKTDVFPIFSTKSNTSRDYNVKEELDCKGTGVVCHAPSGHKLQNDGCKFT